MIIPEQVRDDYEKWNSFLENEVDFWLQLEQIQWRTDMSKRVSRTL